MGKVIHGEKDSEILRLHHLGWNSVQIGQHLEMHRSTVSRRLEGLKPRFPDMPVYSGIPEIKGDAIVAGDIQIPTTDWAFCARVPVVAEKWDIPNLIIAGDLLNLDAFSSFPITEKLAAFKTELETARTLLDSWSHAFKNIYYIMGNHEQRIFRWSKGEMDAELLQYLIAQEKLEAFNESRANLISSGVNWRITHQDAYSVYAGKVGQELALKYQTNVITHHEHRSAVTRDRFNRYTVIQNGGLHNIDTMHYVNQYDNARPVMTQSFVMVRNGVGHLLTPYSDMTDWSLYL